MQEQDIIELLLQRNEKGMDALLLHYGPLMRYIPIFDSCLVK